MVNTESVDLHNTESDAELSDDELAAAIDAALRKQAASDAVVDEFESEETAELEPETPSIPTPPRPEPVYTWPSHGLLVGELSYGDFGDLGKADGGGVGLGHVITTAENPKMIHLRNCIVLYKEASGVRWLNQGKWYRFLDSEGDIVAVLSSVPDDPRIANLQAIQQAEAAREVLFASGRSAERIQPRDWNTFP